MAVTSSSCLSIPLFSSAKQSPISTTSSLKLPNFTGLKLSYGVQSRSIRSLSSPPRILPRSSRIVSETSDTALQLPSVNAETWKSLVLKSDLPVLVEFWAPWCGPCRIIQPVINELSKEFAGKLKVFLVNTDESPSIASDYGVRSIPTVIIFKNGEKKEAIIGAVPKATLTNNLEKFL